MPTIHNEPPSNKNSDPRNDVPEEGTFNIQQMKQDGTIPADSSKPSGQTAGTGSTSGDSTEVVPSETDEMKTRDDLASNWLKEVINDAKNLGKDWDYILAHGNPQEIIDAAINGDKSAQKWLENEQNMYKLSNRMEKHAQMFKLLTQMSRLNHDLNMTAIGNIRV